jgi:autotransporter-associated beta strand protein
MKTNQLLKSSFGLAGFLRATLITAFLPAVVLLLSIQSSRAGSATWLTNPITGDWNTGANWTAGGPPNGSSDMAFFATSNTTAVSLSANTEVNSTVFNAAGSAFTITASPMFTLTISGAGMTNNSGTTQNFVADIDVLGNFGTIAFTNSATAGSLTAFTANGSTLSGAPGGAIQFSGTSTASNGTFTINGGDGAPDACGTQGGTMQFSGTSTAGNGTFVLNAATVDCYLLNPSGASVEFFDSSTAGNGTFILNAATVGYSSGPGVVNFFGTSTAGNGTFTLVGGTTGTGAEMVFHDSSTAGNGVFTVNGAAGAYPIMSQLEFFDNSTADNGIFTVNGGDGSTSSGAYGGFMYFFTQLLGGAGNATLIANGGVNGGAGGLIRFSAGSGGTARVKVFGNGTGDFTNGNLDTSTSNPGPTIGSIEGTGAVFLGASNLTVGSNNLSTTFSGVIQDGGIGGGTGGSLTKVGNGKLTVSKASTYTGGTTVSQGTLLVTNRTGSATGTGAVQVNKGTLGGTGIITGAVTVGTGRRSGAILLPGKSATAPGILTIDSALSFNSLSTYKCVLNRSTVKASKATAHGVTINSNVLFTFVDVGTGTLATGTVFTVINNTSANPISGAFNNLTNGLVFTSNGNNFRVSYTGGTGNDLTLTVVP